MANQPGIWDTLKDAFVLSAMHSPFGGGGIARARYRLQGYSNDQINRAIAASSAEIEARHKNDKGILSGGVNLLGTILGGVDPTYAVGGVGSTLGRRVVSQAAVQGASSVARQGVNVHTGMQKKISGRQVLDDAENGALFQVGGEAVGKAAGAAYRGATRAIAAFSDKHLTPIKGHVEAPLAPDGLPGNGSVRPMDPHEIARIMNDPAAAGGGNDNVPNRRMNNRDIPDHITDEDIQSLPPANREYLEQRDNVVPIVQDEATPHYDQFLQDFHNNELTPAEAQEMDASAPKPVVDNTGYEAHTPYVDELPTPANDIHRDDVAPTEEVPQSPFTEHSEDAQGNKTITYRSAAGEDIPIRMGIDPDGTAEISVDQFGTGKNKLGPAEIRAAMHGLMDMYPEIKRFGGYRRSGAGKGRVQEIEPAPRNTVGDLINNEEGAFTPFGKPKKPKLEDIPDDELTPEQRVMKGMKASEPAIAEQEQARRIELAKRFEAIKKTQYVSGGEAGFHQELSKLSGELPHMPSQYSIRPKLEQGEVDNLFDQIKNHPALSTSDAIHGRTGLQKLLANSGASLPTRSELDVLRKVFTEDPKAGKKSVSSWIADVINAPRSIMASMDLSAPLRQGLPMIHRKEYWTAFGSMFKQIGQEGFDAVKNDIHSRPSYHLMKDSGLALSDIDDVNMSHHEEKFLSNLATKIPVFGHVVRGSERAYVGFLNKLRADTFDSLVNSARASGKKLAPKDIQDIAKYINTATGRGDLNGLVPKFLKGEEFDANKASPLLAGLFFSPRLMASRFQMINPVYYYKLSPIARVEAAKSLLSTVAFTTTALSLAHMAGLKVGYDPRQTDFGKIRVGHTTYDMTGGFSSYMRLIAQTAYGARVNPDGTKTAMPNRIDTIGSFLRNKESPPLSEAHSLLKGVDNNYQKVDRKHLGNVLEDLGKDFIPLVAQDTYGVYKDAGAEQAAISVVPDVFGIGVNTYDPKKKASRKSKPASFEGASRSGFKGF